MASGVYNEAKQRFMDGRYKWKATGGIVAVKLMLVKPTYTFDPDHTTVSQVSGNEVAGGASYVAGHGGAGRKALTMIDAAIDNVDNETELDAADLTWTNLALVPSTDAIRFLVVITETTDGATASTADTNAHLIAAIDLGSDKLTNGGDFTVQWNVEGVLNNG